MGGASPYYSVSYGTQSRVIDMEGAQMIRAGHNE
ncbi:hypothetical protein KIPB_015373, partial [Kipferlia bialata]|eukprot:g15373.t1